MQQPDYPIFAYQRAFESLVEVLPEVKSFLSIGVGTGTSLGTVKRHFPTCDLTGVELEACVVDLAVRYFGAPDREEATYIAGDGVSHLCNSNAQYDLIFVDAYMKNDVYGPCLDPVFPHVLASSLTPQGLAVCNVITRLPFRGRVLEFMKSGANAFRQTLVLPVGVPLSVQNLLVVFSRQDRLLSTWSRGIQQSKRLSPLQRLTFPYRLRQHRQEG